MAVQGSWLEWVVVGVAYAAGLVVSKHNIVKAQNVITMTALLVILH